MTDFLAINIDVQHSEQIICENQLNLILHFGHVLQLISYDMLLRKLQDRGDDLKLIVNAIGKSEQMPKVSTEMMDDIEKVSVFLFTLN